MIWKNNRKKGYPLSFCLSLIFCLFFLSAEAGATPSLTAYMDQVIHRKKKLIVKKCLKPYSKSSTGFMIVEMAVHYSGKAQARVLSTDIKEARILICSLSILNRIKLKNTNQAFTRIYRFFIL